MRLKCIGISCLLAGITVVIYKCTHAHKTETVPEITGEVWTEMARDEVEKDTVFRLDGRMMPYVIDSLTGTFGPDRGVVTLSKDTPDSVLCLMPKDSGSLMVIAEAIDGLTGTARIYRMADCGVGTVWYWRMIDVGDELQRVTAELDSLIRSMGVGENASPDK